MIQLYRNQIQLYRARTGLPAVLDRNHRSNIVDIDASNGRDRCGRCGRDYFDHLWILVNPNSTEQGGVIDCAGVAA